MSPWLWIAVGFGAGALFGTVLLAWSRRTRAPAEVPLETADLLRVVPDPIAMPEPKTSRLNGTEAAPPHLITLLGQAMREPLRQLRRTESCPADALAQLERVAWQTRMLVSRPRPMQAKPTSPISLLQEAAEEVPLLSDGTVGASWSLLNRQPAHVDPERMRAAFRELLESSAAIAGKKGRLGIKILQSTEPGYPVRIEIEIGRRGTDPDPLAMLVTRHIVELQGGRLEVDGNVTRILLRTSAPESISSVA